MVQAPSLLPMLSSVKCSMSEDPPKAFNISLLVLSNVSSSKLQIPMPVVVLYPLGQLMVQLLPPWTACNVRRLKSVSREVCLACLFV
jgi:hypothetical protein